MYVYILDTGSMVALLVVGGVMIVSVAQSITINIY